MQNKNENSEEDKKPVAESKRKRKDDMGGEYEERLASVESKLDQL